MPEQASPFSMFRRPLSSADIYPISSVNLDMSNLVYERLPPAEANVAEAYPETPISSLAFSRVAISDSSYCIFIKIFFFWTVVIYGILTLKTSHYPDLLLRYELRPARYIPDAVSGKTLRRRYRETHGHRIEIVVRFLRRPEVFAAAVGHVLYEPDTLVCNLLREFRVLLGSSVVNLAAARRTQRRQESSLYHFAVRVGIEEHVLVSGS